MGPICTICVSHTSAELWLASDTDSEASGDHYHTPRKPYRPSYCIYKYMQ